MSRSGAAGPGVERRGTPRSHSVALENCAVVRPPFVRDDVEVVAASAAPRFFPAQLSRSFGICLKYGPDHEVDADGKTLIFPRGSISVRPPGSVWACEPHAVGFLSVDVAPELLPDRPLPTSMTFIARGAMSSFESDVRSLMSAESQLQADELVSQLITESIDAATERESPSPTRRREAVLRTAVEYLEAHLGGRPTLDAIAGEAGVDKFTLLRHFKRAYHTTPHAYLVRLRLAHARHMLAGGTPPVEAASAAGFADQAHLTRWFHRVHGITPAAYAREVRRTWTVPISFKTFDGSPANLHRHGDQTSSTRADSGRR
jgi:AraC-like DNA-binding protein